MYVHLPQTFFEWASGVDFDLANTSEHSLAAVNFFLGCVGLIQTSRILMWRSSQKGDSLSQEAKQAAKDETAAGKKILENPVAAAKDATKN